jgi:peptidoglycan/xylan/chitin deacetylase (PgdA/CDA1 family)
MLGIIAGLGAAAAAATAGYASMAPESQLFGSTFIGLESGSRRLALTYDDGPNDPDTMRLLDALDRHGAKATFFMIGSFVRQKPEIARAVAAAGHAIGNHTFTHPNLIFSSPAGIERELADCEAALKEVIGEHAALFRPPFGGRRPGVLRAARARGLTPILWNVTCYDWEPTTPERIEERVRKQMRGGDVILLHDGSHKGMGGDRAATVAATERILARYKQEDYEFVTIPQMMASAAAR